MGSADSGLAAHASPGDKRAVTGPISAPLPDVEDRGEELRRRLSWLLVLRMLVMATLMGTTAVLAEEAAPSELFDDLFVYGLAGAVLFLSAFYAIGLRFARRESGLVKLAYVQLGGDIVFAAGLVVLTGGTDSAFTFFFTLAIIASAIILYRPGALFAATLCTGFLILIGIGEVGGYPEALFGDAPVMGAQEERAGLLGGMVYRLLNNVLAFYAIAFLASSLSERARVSAVKLSEQSQDLQDLQTLNQLIIGSMPSGLLTVDDQHRITTLNPRAAEILGIDGDPTLVGVQELVPEVVSMLRETEDLPEVRRLTTTRELPPLDEGEGPRVQHLGWTISPLLDREGQRVGHILVFQDITNVREMEQQVKRSEQLAAIGQLAASIAHEIRNPLASISGSIQLLSQTAEMDADDRQLMDIVGRETDALNAWITDFLMYARPRRGEAVAHDLTRVVEDAVAVLRHDDKSANIDVDLSLDGPAMVRADPTALRQVVWNLLKNAIEAMPDGGTLRVALTKSVKRSPRHTQTGSGRRMSRPGAVRGGGLRHLLFVSDTGTGISDDVKARIFEPFFTTKEKGTGLGLATVYRIINEQGGSVHLESELGVGTTVTVALPEHVEGA